MNNLKFDNAYVKEIILNGIPGSRVESTVTEAFVWFFSQRVTDKVTIEHVNGVKVTFERVRE